MLISYNGLILCFLGGVMKQIRIGNSNIHASEIALGCMGMGGEWTHNPLTNEVKKQALVTIEAALEQGINFFDHADIYTYGKSEEAFSGIWETDLVKREEIYIQSKCGIRLKGSLGEGSAPHYDFSYQYIIDSVDGILKRLKVDYLDSLLLHRPDALVEPEEVAQAFSELQALGKVRHFGVSNHNPHQIELLKRYIEQDLIVNQMELSLVHANLIDEGMNVNSLTNPIDHRSQGTLEYARLNHMTIQAWSPLATGMLTKEKVEAPYQAAHEVIKEYANEFGVSQEAILMAWLLRHPAKIQPIVGTKNPQRIKAVCEGSQVKLTREQLYRLYNVIPGRSLL